MTLEDAIKELTEDKELYIPNGETEEGFMTVFGDSPDGRLIEALNIAIDAIKSTQWIPVSERLPENIETVLVTNRKGTSVAWYNGYYWERGASTDHRPIKTVTAWMPLPEPYKETEE